MKTVLLSIAGLIVLSQVAPSFYNLVGLEKGMFGGCNMSRWHCSKTVY